MCEYCDDHNHKDLYAETHSIDLFNELDKGYGGTQIKIESLLGDYKILSSFRDGKNRYHHFNFKINYCPMCGRKLSE